MTELMYHDKQVKQDEDLEQDEDDASDMQNHVVSRCSVNRWTRHSVCRCKSFNAWPTARILALAPAPTDRLPILLEIGVCNGRVVVHHLFNNLPDFGKPYFAV